MQEFQGVSFGPYHLAGPRGPLFRKSLAVNLPPKALAVLWELVSHAGQVVTKEDLLATVWVDTVVGEKTLSAFIGILRQALRDEAAQPRYITTVHRVGYRFIAPLSTTPPVLSRQLSVVSQNKETGTASQLATANWQLTTSLVGRDAELALIHNLFVKALNGERQLVFVAGEAGIGKTALIEAFVFSVQRPASKQVWRPASEVRVRTSPYSPTPNPWVVLGWGQCVDHYGAGEAYMPVLEALGQLCRQPEGGRIIEILDRYAPSWLVQMPALVDEAALAALQRKVAGVTRERMLREVAEAIEALSGERPLVLVLEDLHWSDTSTIELLALLARRREVARLLVLGTYRPVELVITNHPLKVVKQELVARGQGTEMLLGGLSREAVHTYVAQRIAQPTIQDEIAAFVHQRTEGHPLFMVQVADYLVQQEAAGVLTQEVTKTIPGGLQQLIELQLGRLEAEARQVLEVASVAGAEFTTASVAAGLQEGLEAIEAVCEGLARREQFIEERGLATWPDGALSGRYGFRHALYQQVLYQQIAEARRIRLHRQIGERLEAGYGERAKEIAAELAMHFERGRDYWRAVRYRKYAAETALQRSAYSEAAAHCTSGLALLPLLPDMPDRVQHELGLQMTLAVVLAATKGFAAPEVEHAYLRARVLCKQTGEPAQLVRVLRGLIILYTVRADFPAARELGEHFLVLAQRAQDAALLELAHMLLGVVLLWQGALTAAQEHFAHGAALADPHQEIEQRRAQTIRSGQDHRIALISHAAWALWLQGYPDQALHRSEEALRLVHELAHPFSSAFALIYAAGVRQFRREEHAAQQWAAAATVLAHEQGFLFLSARGRSVEGWVLTQQGQVADGIAQMRQSLAVYQTLGTARGRPHFLAILAEAYHTIGQGEDGLTLVAEAQEAITITGERWYEAELWRLKGELTLQKLSVVSLQLSVTDPQPLTPDPQAEAGGCFLKAIESARKQQAKSWELRATVSLARLWQRQDKRKEAHQMLADIYGWFTEGFDTKDLQEAKALLNDLRH